MKNTAFAKFLLSCTFAFFGGHITNYSVIFYAQEVLAADLLSGLSFFLCFGMSMVFGWHAGALSDRVNPVRLMQIAHACFLGTASLLLTIEFVLEALWLKKAGLLVASILAGFGWSYISPSRFAALGRLVPSEKLQSATLIFNLLIMVGFGAAPILIAILRANGEWFSVFGFLIFCFSMASLCVLGIDATAQNPVKKTVLKEVKQGLGYLRSNVLVAQALLVSIFAYTMLGPIQVLIPRFALDELALTEMGRGYFMSILAVALIMGGILCTTFLKNTSKGITILVCLLLVGVSYSLLPASGSYNVAAFFLFSAGLLSGVAMSLVVAVMQTNTEDWVRGRIMSMYSMSSQVIPAISGLIAGGLLEWLPLRAGLACSGLLLLALAIISIVKMQTLKSYR